MKQTRAATGNVSQGGRLVSRLSDYSLEESLRCGANVCLAWHLYPCEDQSQLFTLCTNFLDAGADHDRLSYLCDASSSSSSSSHHSIKQLWSATGTTGRQFDFSQDTFTHAANLLLTAKPQPRRWQNDVFVYLWVFRLFPFISYGTLHLHLPFIFSCFFSQLGSEHWG